mmetsp:Transcript_13275/g.24926  ORF Transcript_13275/g.24926 Transcript_13275/m.24926 type:complete len:367 (-) Transcript_13275:154-1254(-)
MKIFTACTIISVAFLVAWIRHRIHEWEAWVQGLEGGLLQDPVQEGIDVNTKTFDQLPAVVQNYFRKVLPENARVIHSVRIHQEGHFYFGSSWVPFEARQTIRAVSPPGFVWDATISMTDKFQQKDLQKSLLPTMQVCDAWVDGGKQAYLRAALVNVFDSIYAKSTINEEDDDSWDEDRLLWVGEAMRWLAEAVIVPTALLPEQGMVEWSAMDDHRALVSLKDPRYSHLHLQNRHVADVKLEVDFDPSTGYINRVAGLRPYEREVLDEKDDLFPLFTRKRTSWEMRRWEGRLANYKKDESTGIVVPRYMEAGWMSDEGQHLEMYFMGNNVILDFELMARSNPMYASRSKPIAEAVVPETPDGGAAMA